jgi:hypothetical protein
MNCRVLVAGALALACSHPAPPPPRTRVGRGAPPVAPPVKRSPAFCPAGTEQVGGAPPLGEVIWCEDEDGRKQGPYRSWYESGELEEEGQFRDGSRIGVWRFFDDKGELQGTKTFRQKVRVKVCVYEKATRRALERALLQITNVESLDTATAFTDPIGMAAVEVDSGRGRVEVAGLFPHFEVRVDLEGSARPIPVALDSASIQKILRVNMGRLTGPAPCARR